MCSVISRRMTCTLAASAALVLAAARPLSAQAAPTQASAATPAQTPAPRIDTSRGLAIRYADGRTVTGPLRRSGGMWTPFFPRVAGADTSRDGVTLTTLDVRHVLEGDDVVAMVSLVYGGPSGHRVTVATVRVPPDSPVEVAELREYGVEAIALSLVPIPAVFAYSPLGTSVSPYVDVRAEALGPNASAYRVTVTNGAPAALMWFQFRAHRGAVPPISGRPRGKRNLPLILPGAQYTFEISTNSVAIAPGERPDVTWHPVERIDMTSLMWDDGVVEGEAEPAEQQRALDTARAAHIGRLLLHLRAARDGSVGTLRTQLARTAAPDVETEQVRDELLSDLAGFERSQSSTAFEKWLTGTIGEHEAWLARIVARKP